MVALEKSTPLSAITSQEYTDTQLVITLAMETVTCNHEHCIQHRENARTKVRYVPDVIQCPSCYKSCFKRRANKVTTEGIAIVWECEYCGHRREDF